MIIRITMISGKWYDIDLGEADDIMHEVNEMIDHPWVKVLDCNYNSIYVNTSNIENVEEHPIKFR